MIPQLLGYWLTGEKKSEHTLASTGGVLRHRVRRVVRRPANAAGRAPGPAAPRAVQPTDVIGTLRPAHRRGPGPRRRHAAGGGGQPRHRVGRRGVRRCRARAARTCPAGPGRCWGSSWPHRSAARRRGRRGFTNEGGGRGDDPLPQEPRRACGWCRSAAGPGPSGGRTSASGFAELADRAEAAGPSDASIDADDPRFAAPGDMPARVREAAAERGGSLPDEPGAVVRCVLESLATAYAGSLAKLTEVTGREIDRLHLVGGGRQQPPAQPAHRRRLRPPRGGRPDRGHRRRQRARAGDGPSASSTTSTRPVASSATHSRSRSWSPPRLP